MRPNPAIIFWQGESHPLAGGLTLVRCGGHFEGGTVLHWPDGSEGKGALLTGDILQVCADRTHVSVMYSYPNYIPLSAAVVERILGSVQAFAYDRLYGAFWDSVIAADARDAVRRSADLYCRALGDA